jgi:hypothetical protein
MDIMIYERKPHCEQYKQSKGESTVTSVNLKL